MAFSSSKLSRISGGASAANGVTVYCYKDTATDNLATISGSGYFNSVSNIRVGDIIFVEGSDGRDVYAVTATGTVTVAEFNTSSVADGSITAIKLAANSVTDPKISSGALKESKFDAPTAAKLLGTNRVTNNHMTDNSIGTNEVQNAAITANKMAAGLLPLSKQLYTTTGGSASEDVTIGGVLATDIVLATLHTAGATPRQLDRAVCAAGKVTLHFSDDPSTDHKVNILVYRP